MPKFKANSYVYLKHEAIMKYPDSFWFRLLVDTGEPEAAKGDIIAVLRPNGQFGFVEEKDLESLHDDTLEASS